MSDDDMTAAEAMREMGLHRVGQGGPLDPSTWGMTHTHPGDGTVPGLHGEPIPTPVLGCPACATVHSIGGELGSTVEQSTPNRRKIRTGETFDLAPHEVVDVVDEHHGVLWTIDGGPGGMQGARIE